MDKQNNFITFDMRIHSAFHIDEWRGLHLSLWENKMNERKSTLLQNINVIWQGAGKGGMLILQMTAKALNGMRFPTPLSLNSQVGF